MGKKTSSEDFMNLLDDQDGAAETMAFDPAKKSGFQKKPGSSARSRPSMKIGGYQLGPVQQELVEFVLKRTPAVVTKWATSSEAKLLLGRVEHSVVKVRRALQSLRTRK